MSVSLALVVTAAVLVGTGVYLMLERSLTRVLVGLVLLSNGVNIAFLLSSGRPGEAPLVLDGRTAEDMADPLPQALVLTAIVITLGTTAFLLAMAHRSWQLNGNDDVQDDIEDATIRRLALADDVSEAYEIEGHDDEHDHDDHPDEDRGHSSGHSSGHDRKDEHR